jgi:hypothetical protein
LQPPPTTFIGKQKADVSSWLFSIVELGGSLAGHNE